MRKKAYFAGGCFWCIEPVFESMPGVFGAVSGYSGGVEADPSYEDVKAQRTGTGKRSAWNMTMRW